MSAEDHSGTYKKVVWALLVLTAVTVYVGTQVNFGTRTANIIVGVVIAVIKASLVTAIFMHMKYEKRWWLGLVLFPLALVMIIIFSNFADTALNGNGEGHENGEFTSPAAADLHAGGGAGAKH